MNKKKISVLFLMAILVASCERQDASDQPQATNSLATTDSPPIQVESLGFEPEKACSYLSSIEGMSTRLYKQSEESNEYWCFSFYKDIGDESSPELLNNIAYYAKGGQDTVKQLKIVLNVNQPDDMGAAKELFLEAARTLTMNALDSNLPAKLEKAIENETSKHLKMKKYALELDKDIWSSGQGYSLVFIIKDPQYSRK